MDITSHPIMNGIRKWIMENDWNVMRLHLSHNDLDGHSCHIMTRLATNVLNPNSKSSLTFWTTSAGKDNVEKTILKFIDKMQTVPKDQKRIYVKGKKKLFILITDLGGFNPDFFNQLIEEGHLINYLYIDHHQIPDGYNRIELKGNTEEFQMAENCYYVNDSVCAAKSIGDAIRAAISQKRTASTLSHTMLHNTMRMLHEVERFTERVDRFDRGLWGEWVGLDSFDIDGSVAEHLFFKSYLPEEKYKYVSLMANLFHTYLIGVDLPVKEKPFWCVNIDKHNVTRNEAIAEQLAELNQEFEYFKSITAPATVPIYIPDTIPNKDKLNIYQIITKEGEIAHSFTLISREILREHPEIDILALVYTHRSVIDMRTARNDLNLFTIAFANGGGGHPKAAGFPVKKDEE